MLKYPDRFATLFEYLNDIIETITAAIDAKKVSPIPTAENILNTSLDS